MVRTQIQLSERQSRRLKAIAAHQGTSVAELIRRAVDRALDANELNDLEDIKRRAREAYGQFSDTATDVAMNHDKYLAEAILNDHLRR